MLERRKAHRRRVCLGAQVTAGMHSPITTARVRNVTPFGAEVVAVSGQIEAVPLHIRLGREDAVRRARIVWRRMDRFGLEFVDEDLDARASPAGPERLPAPEDDVPGALARRFQMIVSRASRSV